MDILEKFKAENLTEGTIKEINDLTLEQLESLQNEKCIFLIEDVKSKVQGQATYQSLASLKKKNLKDKFEVISLLKKPLVYDFNDTPTPEPAVEEVIEPAIPLFNENESVTPTTAPAVENSKNGRGRKKRN